jgi:hypothetical protein
MVNVGSVREGKIQIDVIDVLGVEIFSSLQHKFSGDQTLPVELQGVSEGVYFVRIRFDGHEVNHKIMVE